jgi:hypothetical protein
MRSVTELNRLLALAVLAGPLATALPVLSGCSVTALATLALAPRLALWLLLGLPVAFGRGFRLRADTRVAGKIDNLTG